MVRTVNPEAHARRRALIVAAATEEFATHGVDGTNIAGICRRAGIGAGTLYHYFPAKIDVFYAVFADDLPHVTELCATALAEPDPDVGLDRIVEHLTGELLDPLAPGLASAAYLQANRDPEFGALVERIDSVRIDAVVTLLQRCADQPGRSLPFAPDATARWIQGLVDASHLGAIDRSPTQAIGELRRIVDWLVGRTP